MKTSSKVDSKCSVESESRYIERLELIFTKPNLHQYQKFKEIEKTNCGNEVPIQRNQDTLSNIFASVTKSFIFFSQLICDSKTESTN